mmetsp:Transcript_6865/g.13018  ORF Transcript_6865/g.13018 Transcript_6865/m.13018 type:complete len:287 (-) Transcript_6865:409-1269(-)
MAIISRIIFSPPTKQASTALLLRSTRVTNFLGPKPSNKIAIRRFADKTTSNGTAATENATSAGTKTGGTGSSSSSSSSSSSNNNTTWWNDAKFWGGAGAIAGWGMSGAAIYDAVQSSPEVISLNMTGVLIVYSSLFARWAWIVKPQNLLLSACHVTNVGAQINQMRRALEYKRSNGEDEAVNDILMKAGATAVAGAAFVLGGPALQNALVNANLGVVSTVAGADAGPFTVHFWAPMSKWLISGASFFELDRPTDKISLAQYSALTLTGFFFSRYALLVTPINYTLW